MYLRRLRVENLKLLRDFEMSFVDEHGEPRMWTMLLGENGLCKTTILQAIAMAASGSVRAKMLANVPSLRDRRLEHSDKDPVQIQAEFGFSETGHGVREYPRLDPKPPTPPILHTTLFLEAGQTDLYGTATYEKPIELAAHDLEELIAAIGEFLMGRRSRKSINKLIELIEHSPLEEARSRQLPYWLVVGYGVDRRLPVPDEQRTLEDITVDRLRSLFGKGSIIGTGFFDLFRLADVPAPSNGHERKETESLAAVFARTLAAVLTEGEKLLPRVTGVEMKEGGLQRAQDLIEKHRFAYQVGPETIRVPASWLSQGYQGLISWVADLVGQILWEGRGPVPAAEMEGIVLVDEIDLHLHPAWQVVVVRALKKVFPRLQFIATTHSPMVLPFLKREEVFILAEDEAGNIRAKAAPESPALLTGSGIYAKFFGLEEIFPHELGEMLWRYRYLAADPTRSDKDEEEVWRLRAELTQAEIDPGPEPVARETHP